LLCYAILSGPDYSLSLDEIAALLEIYGSGSRPEASRRIAIFECQRGDLERIAKRASYSKEVGRVITITEDVSKFDPSLLAGEFSGLEFKVDSEGFGPMTKKLIDASLGELILRHSPGSRVNLQGPRKVLRVLKDDGVDGRIIFGVRSGRVKGGWRERRPRARPFFHPVAMFPKLSRLMVNLARVKSGDIFLDPCVGTGSLLLEATEMQIESLGMDVSKRMLFGASRNLRGYAAENWHILQGDARRIPLRCVSGVATDVPYGRASPTRGGVSEHIEERILDECGSLLKKGGYLVMMTSSISGVHDRGSLRLVSSYDLYVHWSLTRKLSVYRNE
jgi:tRNA (guanine10-N2)-dimethyltransferase